MTERQLQFRVGLFVTVALTAAAVMVFEFGEFEKYWRPTYKVAVHFRTAPGVSVSTPAKRSGIPIGVVSDVQFDEEHGGVLVILAVQEDVRLASDTKARLTSSLFGDSSIEFLPGRSRSSLKDGDRLEGETGTDPMNAINNLERNVSVAIKSFEETSREWQTVGRNINSLVETNSGNLHLVIGRAVQALDQLTTTMKNADLALAETSRIVADPQNQENLRKTLATLPQLAAETQKTVATVRLAVEKADQNLQNLAAVTGPLSKRSVTLATRLENALANLETLTAELAQFSKLLNQKDGSAHKLAADPELYQNLNRSAESFAALLKNLEPIVGDLRVFSDKVARHPELIGVSGALRGSSGLKDPSEAEPGRISRGTKRSVRQ